MAQNITLLGASYSDVPAVTLPKTGGGSALFADPSVVTATASDVAQGKYFIDSSGTLTEGTSSGGGTAAISVVDTTDTAGGTIRTITALDISDTTAVASDVASGKYFYTADGVKTQGSASGGSANIDSLTVTPTTSQQIFNSSSVDGYKPVTVNAIPSQYIVPTGNLAITQNGTGIDVSQYATVSVAVSGGGGASLPWFGIGNAELVHTSNYEIALSDTNWSSLTPSTSAQTLTLPATTYSSAGTQVTFDEYTPDTAIMMTEKSMVIVIDAMTDVKYLTDESTMGIAHILRCYGSCVYVYGLNASVTSNVISLQSPIGVYAHTTAYQYRTSGNAMQGGTGLYGFYNEVYTPAPVLSSGLRNVTKISYPVTAKMRNGTNIMTTTAWNNVDATNTKLKVRMKTYLVDYPAPKTGVSARVADMYNNGTLPTD